jgi:hypothetical protein
MPVDVKQLTCPKCGSPLDLKNAGRSKSIVCASCGSQIDLTSPEFQIIGNVGQRPAPQATQFKLGLQGAISGQTYEIIGRVVYHDEEDDIWDEWLLLSAAGEYVWISDSVNEGMALWRSFVPTEPVAPDTIKEGARLNLRNAQVTVRDAGRAKIDYLEGELTWKARVGDKMNYAEADGATQRISIEYTENEIEFYWGQRLDRVVTARAFGVTEAPTQFRSAAGSGVKPFKGCMLVGLAVFGSLLCVLVLAFSGSCSTPTITTASAAPICMTVAAPGTLVPGAATPQPICFTPTAQPASSGGCTFSIRSGSSSGRSIGGGSSGHSSSGHSSGGK